MVVVGPMAHTVADLRFFFKTVLEAEPWFSDPKCLEVPSRQDRADKLKIRPLTFGIIKWDRLIMPHPPVLRGVKMVAEALKAQGHEIIEFDVPDAAEADRLTVPTPPPGVHFLSWFFRDVWLIVVTHLCCGWRKRYPRCLCLVRRANYPEPRIGSKSRSARRYHQRSLATPTP